MTSSIPKDQADEQIAEPPAASTDYTPDGSGGDTSGGGADAVIVLGQD
jgi:hypothetical protein